MVRLTGLGPHGDLAMVLGASVGAVRSDATVTPSDSVLTAAPQRCEILSDRCLTVRRLLETGAMPRRFAMTCGGQRPKRRSRQFWRY